MDVYARDMIEDHIPSLPYLETQLDVDHMLYEIPDPSSVASSMRNDIFDQLMSGATGNLPLRTDRSLSYSDASSQSLSPQLQYQQPMSSHQHDLAFSAQMFTRRLDTVSPSTSVPVSNDEPSDEDHKVERRRAQNRAAQRAYRQRKDQNLKQREREVEKLRDELERAQRLNATLCKVVAALRERLKEPSEEIENP